MKIITSFRDTSDCPIRGTVHFKNSDGLLLEVPLDANGKLSDALESDAYTVTVIAEGGTIAFGPAVMTVTDGRLTTARGSRT
jgi:hypothetical protein